MSLDRVLFVPVLKERPSRRRGYGGNTNSPAGHRYKPGQLLYGNGCKKHDDCFTCPLPECVFDHSLTKINHAAVRA